MKGRVPEGEIEALQGLDGGRGATSPSPDSMPSAVSSNLLGFEVVKRIYRGSQPERRCRQEHDGGRPGGSRARPERRVLFVDLDPQGNATWVAGWTSGAGVLNDRCCSVIAVKIVEAIARSRAPASTAAREPGPDGSRSAELTLSPAARIASRGPACRSGTASTG